MKAKLKATGVLEKEADRGKKGQEIIRPGLSLFIFAFSCVFKRMCLSMYSIYLSA